MAFDCIIIGGGLAGLTCGITCLELGARCAVLTAGMSALHFSSGAINVLGIDGSGAPTFEPFEHLPGLIAASPQHPYALCGREGVRAALDFFVNRLQSHGYPLHADRERNHWQITAMGMLVPVRLSPRSMFSPVLKTAFSRHRRLAVLGIDGYRDFHARLVMEQLARQKSFDGWQITCGNIRLPVRGKTRNRNELRSIDIGRLLDDRESLGIAAADIRRQANGAPIVLLPAVLGIHGHRQLFETLQAEAGVLIREIPTLPPSLPGMRLDNALKTIFVNMGGVLVNGERAIGGTIAGDRVIDLRTAHQGPHPLGARCYVLATGSFFSGGLVSDAAAVREPVFDLQVDDSRPRGSWSAERLLDPRGHAFLGFGVRTDDELRALTSSGRSAANLFCCGAVLAGYDPVAEGSGGGVAVATGFKAAIGACRQLGIGDG